MNKLISWTSLLLASLFAIQSHGAGTSAGTAISNQASVTYDVGGGSVTRTSNTVNVTVQELIDVVISSQNTGNVSVSSPDTEVALKFQISNTGNGDEAFIVQQVNLSDDDFDVTLSTIYLDDGDGVFNSNLDSTYDNATSIPSGDSITIWVTSDIPGGKGNNQTANIQVSALSKTFNDDSPSQTNPQPGDVVTSGGDPANDGSNTNTDAVYGRSGAAIWSATFLVSAIEVTIVKAIGDINDNLGLNNTNVSGKPIPGADVEYSLTVTVTGTGDATNVTVTDPLPSELILKGGSNGSIFVNGVERTAASGDDNASYDANTDTITVELGTITAGGSDSIITFTTVIQ